MEGEKKEGLADDQLDEVISGLVEEYKKKHNEEPSEEVMKQWIETIKSANLEMGAAAKEAEAQAAPVNADTTSTAVLTGADIDELMGIAWECLEASRVIYSRLLESLAGKEGTTTAKKLLAKTLLRLGDHSMEIGRFEFAVSDFEKCLKLREEVFETASREIPDVHSVLATAFLYASSEENDMNAAKLKRFKALMHYTKATEAILALRQKLLGYDAVAFDPLDTKLFQDNEEEDESTLSKKPVSEAKQTVSSLSDTAKTFLANIKARLKSIEGVVEAKTVDASSTKDEDKKEAAELTEIVKEMVMKVDDVIQVLENPEASEAMTKSAEIVEEAIEKAAASASAFDKPTLDAKESEENESGNAKGEPTNLLQARKKVDSPAGIKRQVEGEATSKEAVQTLNVKRKAEAPAATDETSGAKKIKA